ncbi:hypothetical protein V8E55_001211 [Tylopilus felleus]
MFSDPVSFNGGTRVEVIAVLANCGRDTDRARRALVTWIQHKQDKGRTTEHILIKLRDIESKFIKDATLHSAFRDARAETYLPRAPDLPLPAYLRRKSIGQNPEAVPSVIIPDSTGRSSISSSLDELPANSLQTSPSICPSRLSRASSQVSEIVPGKINSSQRLSLPQGVSRVAQSRSPRIQIPRDRSTQPAPNSPITSSPEESELHFRYRSMSHPVGPSSQPTGLITPVSASPPEFSSFRDQNFESRRHLSYGLVSPPPSVRVQIPRSRSQRSFPHSPPTSSSDESDFHPRRYRPMSQPIRPMSPARHRLGVTPPRTCPPDLPLPPIPSDDQGVDSDSVYSMKSMLIEQPPTPLRSPAFFSCTPIRPLPIQPIPSPVPGSDESEPTDTIGADSLRQNWRQSSGDLPVDIVVRQDSPVYMFHDEHVSLIDMPMIGESLDSVVDECGGPREVRVVVSKCIEFERGYEPPYWQSRLQACGLDLEAARHLVDEMCRQVDWGTSFRRST